jgi:hypothetical protein
MKSNIQKELDTVAGKHNGLLRPKDIVDYAANEKTSLHKCFEWDNKKAGHEYRLWQARELISVYVKVLKQDTEPVRAYVSLLNDRAKEGGGYRTIEAVLNDNVQRNQLLSEALAELERFEAKYRQLKDLAGVFKAIKKVKTRKLSVA